MTPDRSQQAAIVVGASGGIGAALADALAARGYGAVHRLARSGPVMCDLTDSGSIGAALAAALDGPQVTCAIIATGVLHDEARGPEKALRELDAQWLARQFAVNAIGPALLLAQLLPRLPRDRPVRVAALVALHPGTVATRMSAPFARSTEGKRLLSAEESAAALLGVLDGLTPEQSGRIFDWQGQEIAP